MTKKSRVNKDALDWFEGPGPTDKPVAAAQTSKSARPKKESSSAAEKTISATKSTQKITASADKQRKIFVAHKKADGEIVATLEFTLDNLNDSDVPWSELSDDITTKSIRLTGGLADKTLIDIHKNYKVTGSGKLEPKTK